MMQDVHKHKGSYILLALVATLYLYATYQFRNTPSIVVYLTLGFGCFYLLWGIVHHLMLKSLSGKVMLEYFLVTTLGVIIMSTLLL